MSVRGGQAKQIRERAWKVKAHNIILVWQSINTAPCGPHVRCLAVFGNVLEVKDRFRNKDVQIYLSPAWLLRIYCNLCTSQLKWLNALSLIYHHLEPNSLFSCKKKKKSLWKCNGNTANVHTLHRICMHSIVEVGFSSNCSFVYLGPRRLVAAVSRRSKNVWAAGPLALDKQPACDTPGGQSSAAHFIVLPSVREILSFQNHLECSEPGVGLW